MEMKNKILLIFTLFLLIFPMVYAEEKIVDWIYDTNKVTYDVEIKSSFVPSNSPEQVKVILSLFPQDTESQRIISMESEGTVNGDKINFFWEGPVVKRKEFGINSQVEITPVYPKVKTKVDYPLTIADNKEIKKYLKSTDSVDVYDENIVELAQKLTKGEDDALKVVHNFASWVESNIEYSLSSMTSEASLKSSWVLKNRKGVCDELTNLFIALNRAAGIPARFVAGVSYTNSPLFPEGWGLHGWAEVYLPEYGWIPVDVTYKQFGKIDLSHIVLKISEDATDPSTSFTWKNGDIDSSGLDVDAKPISHSGTEEKLLDIQVYPLKKQIGFGSYNLVVAEIENLQDFYIGENFELTVAENTLEIVDLKNKQVLLGPKEKKTLYWLIKSKNDLDKNYKYTSPLKVYNSKQIIESSVNTVSRDKIYSLKDMQPYLDLSDEEEEDENGMSLDCSLSKDKVSEDEEISISCNLKNVGNEDLKNLNVCIDGNCQVIGLEKNGEKILLENIRSGEEGIQNVRIKASNDKINKLKILPLNVEADVKLELELKAPAEMTYTDEREILLEVSKRRGNIQNSKLNIFLNGRKIKTATLADNTGGLSFALPGSLLSLGKNEISYKLSYEDKEGNSFENVGNGYIDLVNVNTWQKVKIFLRNLFQ
jgi:transglutaminase-like putative cysteine protease